MIALAIVAHGVSWCFGTTLAPKAMSYAWPKGHDAYTRSYPAKRCDLVSCLGVNNCQAVGTAGQLPVRMVQLHFTLREPHNMRARKRKFLLESYAVPQGASLRPDLSLLLLLDQEALGHLEVSFQDGPRCRHDLDELTILCLARERGDRLQRALMHLNLV